MTEHFYTLPIVVEMPDPRLRHFSDATASPAPCADTRVRERRGAPSTARRRGRMRRRSQDAVDASWRELSGEW